MFRFTSTVHRSFSLRKSGKQGKKIRNGKFDPRWVHQGTLTNGGKIVAFKRNLLLDFFRDWKSIFDFEETNTVIKKPTNHEDEKVNNDPNKITEITDIEVINQMVPLLKGNRVLEAATLCHKHYSAKYKGMKIKDWLDIANDMYKSIGKN